MARPIHLASTYHPDPSSYGRATKYGISWNVFRYRGHHGCTSLSDSGRVGRWSGRRACAEAQGRVFAREFHRVATVARFRACANSWRASQSGHRPRRTWSSARRMGPILQCPHCNVRPWVRPQNPHFDGHRVARFVMVGGITIFTIWSAPERRDAKVTAQSDARFERPERCRLPGGGVDSEQERCRSLGPSAGHLRPPG
jgi:hypothetical protein